MSAKRKMYDEGFKKNAVKQSYASNKTVGQAAKDARMERERACAALVEAIFPESEGTYGPDRISGKNAA